MRTFYLLGLLSMFILLFLLLLAPVSVALAQDTTPPPSNGGQVVLDIFTALGGILAAFAAGGIVGVAGISLFIQRLRNDTATLNAIERLYTSIPQDAVRDIIRSVIEVWVETGELLDDITDGEPNEPRSGA